MHKVKIRYGRNLFETDRYVDINFLEIWFKSRLWGNEWMIEVLFAHLDMKYTFY